ncbi:hypothetical protein CSAL01_01103 [Colletotrichum salicis]|uniref:Uncharacterized protein n=1 Tax=Colletotrichum salicis TaxID=1209931 RepID=A0A135V5F9_9PEZI|nr:hypothetical protein CSAL01_01103 [Colletotrichum salicis]
MASANPQAGDLSQESPQTSHTDKTNATQDITSENSRRKEPSKKLMFIVSLTSCPTAIVEESARHNLVAVDKALVQGDWDKLDFRPFILANRALFGAFLINCGILAGPNIFSQQEIFSVSKTSYYILQALLIMIRTCTVAHLESMLLNLYRMTPFILCAGKEGATAGETILRSYFPSPSLTVAWETKNWFLLLAYITYYPSYLAIGFKSALLYEDYGTINNNLYVNIWACYTLTAFYSVIQVNIVAFAIYLWKHPTGLRCDPVSIADILVLFRQSDILKDFEESSIADRESMMEKLKGVRLCLKHRKRNNNKIWHGFGCTGKTNDIVSWSSTSQLLHQERSHSTVDEAKYNDPLDVDEDVKGDQGSRWYMQSRLELQLKRLRLGYTKVPGKEYFVFGITDEEPASLPDVRVSRLSRKLEVQSKREEEGLPQKLSIPMGNSEPMFKRVL